MATVSTVLALVMVFAAGCSSGNDDAQQTQTTRPPAVSSPATAPGAQGGMRLYFVKAGAVTSLLRPGSTSGRRSVESLLAGPTAAEAGDGLSSSIPAGTRLISYSFSNGAAHVDFSGEMLNFGGGSARVATIIEQVKATVLANEEGARSVALTIQGVPVEEALQP